MIGAPPLLGTRSRASGPAYNHPVPVPHHRLEITIYDFNPYSPMPDSRIAVTSGNRTRPRVATTRPSGFVNTAALGGTDSLGGAGESSLRAGCRTNFRVARHPGLSPRAYFAGREPVIRMSTSLLALCCQSGLDATWATPMSARSRSNGSRSFRMSPLQIARFTKARRASWTCA